MRFADKHPSWYTFFVTPIKKLYKIAITERSTADNSTLITQRKIWIKENLHAVFPKIVIQILRCMNNMVNTQYGQY